MATQCSISGLSGECELSAPRLRLDATLMCIELSQADQMIFSWKQTGFDQAAQLSYMAALPSHPEYLVTPDKLSFIMSSLSVNVRLGAISIVVSGRVDLLDAFERSELKQTMFNQMTVAQSEAAAVAAASGDTSWCYTAIAAVQRHSQRLVEMEAAFEMKGDVCINIFPLFL